jgi:hypothetical protein
MGFTMPCEWKVEGVKPHENWDYSHSVHPKIIGWPYPRDFPAVCTVSPNVERWRETPESWHLGMIPRKLSCNEVSISNSYMIRWICGSVILNACWTWICEFHVTGCLKLSQQIRGLEGELGPCWASQWFLIGTLLAGFLCYVQRPGLSSVLMYSLNIIHCGFLWQSSTPKSV